MVVKNNIEIGGEKRPVYFGFRALAVLAQSVKIQYHQITSTEFLSDLSNQVLLIKVGLEEGARRNAESSSIEIEINTIYDWLDDRPQALDEILGVFTEDVLTIQAKKTGQDPKKLIAATMEKAAEIVEAKN